MTATEINRFVNKEPGRGRIYSGIFNILLTGYVKATGFTLNAATFGVSKLEQLMFQAVDCPWVFAWDPATGTLTILDGLDGAEIETNEADDDNVRVMYWGF
jgi:hypothetical protein